MDRQMITGQWASLLDPIKRRWDRLSDDDLGRVAGKYEEFVSLIAQRYGKPRHEVETEIADFMLDRDPSRGQPHE